MISLYFLGDPVSEDLVREKEALAAAIEEGNNV
jgi:hypothetical protein